VANLQGRHLSPLLRPIVEIIAPAKLGRSFRWLISAAIFSNAGDGIALAAGPLLVASQTRDPLIVSLALLAEVLPPLLFGFLAGAAADRLDRRRIVAGVNLVRAIVLALLAATIAGGTVSIVLVLGALFVLGTAETFANVSSSSLLPRLVQREDLGVANARMQGALLFTNQLLTPPIGAFLFAVGMALPFATDAACFALGSLLVTRVVMSRTPETGIPGTVGKREGPSKAPSLRADLAEGLRWLMGHPPMRTLVLTILAFNVTFGAAWSVLVLYARDRLGMDAVGFGLITTAIAVGGLFGTAAYGRLERRFSLGNIMRVGLLIETATHLTLALTRSPAIALGTMIIFGAHAFIWGTTATTIRQRAVPDALLGRVTGVYTVGTYGGIALGTPIGGLLARTFGVTAPFWFGFAGSAILVVILWRQFEHIGHAGSARTTAKIADVE
jgi:predicted MFS family arabinose efflux permease